MKNNLENKAKFFAQYWGQNVMIDPTVDERLFPVTMGNIEYKINDPYLLLKPLSSISDEDAVKVARMAHQLTDKVTFNIKRTDNGNLIHLTWLDHINRQLHVSINKLGCVNANCHFLKTESDEAKRFKINIGEIQTCSMRPIPYIAILDYLRSKGYAMPFNGLSIEELVKRGWVRLKTI